jgi:glycosyltransferase involved in cell wall biosynthesis
MLVFPKALALAHTARLLKADHIHAHWASTTATAAYVASSMSGIPWSFTAHRWDIQEDNMLKEKVRTASFVRVINKRGLTEIDRIVGYELSRKVRVIHMGVDTEKYGPARFGLPNTSNDKTPLIVCPANFVPVKGHRYLLDALAQVKLKGLSFKCWFFGAGPLEDALKRQTAELCLTDYVDFRGRLPHPELLELFNSGLVDIVVLPSIVTKDGACEGIPVALMEAMAAGIPVVSTRTGGIPELVEGAGLLVDPADSTELASAIMELIGNPELRLKLAEAGRSAVQRDFSLSSIVLQLSESMASGVGGFLPPNLDKAGQKEVRLQ